jgi:CxxC motif-containing protein (DUF1111 family)
MNPQFGLSACQFPKVAIGFAIAILAAICLAPLLPYRVDLQTQDPLAGGETTVANRTSLAFSQPAPNLSEKEVALHKEGDRAFGDTFVTAPAPVNAGLGPLFNNSSCIACHIHDGRGMPTKGSLLVRVSLPPSQAALAHQPISAGGNNSHQSSIFGSQAEASVSLGNAPPVPNLGTQLQDQAIYGVKPKATVYIKWHEKNAVYSDGTPYQLRSPIIDIVLADGKPLPLGVLTSARVPPPVFGHGLLEAVPERDIIKLADPQDKDNDGISGKPNRVWDVRQKRLVLGRFGLKSNNPNLFQQNAAAYVNDMGITNPLFLEKDGTTEIDLKTLNAVTFYTQTLSVPSRTLTHDPVVKKGETLFAQANCAACHIGTLQTGNHSVKAVANQTIHPYTDLLLHNMGEGLADGRPDFEASGNEWRTAPLWGLGLTQTVLPYTGYLHDGRARTLEETILWHGGEAERSKEVFRTMAISDRTALIQFLNSL